MSSNEFLTAGISIIVIFCLMLYSIFGAIIEKKKPILGHEAAFIIIIGLLISVIVFYIDDERLSAIETFDDEFFFFICLPPIVFASGFNMQRQQFFNNINYVLLFGIVTTFVCFGLFSGLSMAI